MFSKVSSMYTRIPNIRAFERVFRRLTLNFCRMSSTSETSELLKGKKLQVIAENWTRKLQKYDVPEAELSVKYIVEKALDTRANDSNKLKHLLCNTKVSQSQENSINEMCTRRLNREPIQYIVGDWDFRHMTLLMKPPVFIPRPETEELVDIFSSHHFKSSTNGNDDFILLEVGCGSGAISLSILYENTKVSCVAIDTNPDAVALTKQNAVRCGLQDRVTICNADIGYFFTSTKFDAIVSNPPYIPRQDMNGLQPEVNRYEDQNALCGGEDGMDVIKTIFNKASFLLKPHGSIWLEMDLSHPPLVRKWLQDHPSLGLKVNKFYNDFTGRTRFCHVITQNSPNHNDVTASKN